MAVMKLRENEFRAVMEVMSRKGIELCYSIEKDGVYVYGSDSELAEIEHVLWAAAVV